MLKTEKSIQIKKNSRNIISVVREHYLRSDIPCKSKRCQKCEKIAGLASLPIVSTHYIIASCEITKKYFEILQLKEIVGIIFLQTVVNYVQKHSSKRLCKQLSDLVKDQVKECIVFNNEFHESCYIARKHGDCIEEWRTKCLYKAALWYYQHLQMAVPIVIITEDLTFKEYYGGMTAGILVMDMAEYIHGFWPDLSDAHGLLESLKTSCTAETNTGKNTCKEFREYYATNILLAGIKSGQLFSGYLRVNKHNPVNEAFVQVSSRKDSSLFDHSDMIIPGVACRNRAIDGDLVVVELLPENEWQSKTGSIADKSDETSSLDKDSSPMMTGHVVGILQRNLRDFVVSTQESMDSSSKKNAERILTIPWDTKIPKIRISTRQAAHLKDKRFVVRIDSWEVDSFYPNGHFVKSLGAIGALETEIATILIEHGLSVAPFSEGILKEMPLNTEDCPWEMNDREISIRKDLRASHLVFSIDPVGCEDVDDTLSVRHLPGGVTELGVHIADVTHFVKPNSLTDLEAKARSTTVYLADRRYDMLPEVLSAQLCSLVSGVDRYAVSVIWKLDKKFEVLDVWYGRTVIRSSYKLFYEAAQKIADGELTANEASEVVPELKCLSDQVLLDNYLELKRSIEALMNIARHLKAKRSQHGAVDLESVEIQIHVGNEKEVQDLSPKKALEIHETIAECMIFANHWVAKKIKDAYRNSALLRMHPPPNQDYFNSLKHCCSVKGYNIETSSNHQLAESLDRCTDVDPNVNKIFRMLATQAMMVASYFSTGSFVTGHHLHYGLALDAYTHFTSPIRRYADVIVHRLLLASVNDPSTNGSLLLSNKSLQELCEHMNTKHREADHAQKESLKLFQAMYFKQHADDDMCLVDAIVYSLRSNGVLIYIPKYGIKGAVVMKDKDGKVACPTKDGSSVLFCPGELQRYSDKLIITPIDDKDRHIPLFSYIKVRIKVHTSRPHCDNLHFQLVCFKTEVKFEEKVPKGKFVQTVKDDQVSSGEVLSEDSNETFKRHKQLYGQTHKSVSLYELFQAFKKSAIEVN